MEKNQLISINKETMLPRHTILFRFLIAGFLLSISTSEMIAQVVLNGGIINLSLGASLVITTPDPSGITRISLAGGHIISEGQSNVIQWNMGTNTGAYTIPWGYGASNYIPLQFSKGAGSGSGNFVFSTYHTGWQNSSHLPAGVTNMNDASGTANSAFASDRFWQINAEGFGTKPDVTNVPFTYLDIENSDP